MNGQLRVLLHMLSVSFRAGPARATLVVLLVTVQAGSVAGLALAQRSIVDRTGGWTGVLLAALAGAVAYAAIAAGNRVQSNLRMDIAERVELDLTRDIITTSAAVPTIVHLELPEYLDRMSLVVKGSRALAAACWSVAETGSALISLSLTVWLLGSVHPAMVLVALLGLPPLLFARRGDRILRDALDAVAGLLRLENEFHRLCVTAADAKEVRISDSVPYLSRRADELWFEAARAERRARIRAAGWKFGGWLCFAAGFAGAVIVVTSLAGHRSASLGDIVMVITLCTRLRAQVGLAVWSIGQVGEAGNVAGHYLWLKEYARSQPIGERMVPHRLGNGLTLSGVGFRYPGASEPALHGIDLHIPAGSTLGLVGFNGSGKSTLVKLLTGVYRPDAGRIEVDGVRLETYAPREWAASTTGIFQDFVKYQFTVREVVGIGDLARLDDTGAVSAAAQHADAERVVQAAGGWDGRLGPGFGGLDLSHGQWQKLALARGFMRRRPLVVLLDEPSAALDPDAEHELFTRVAKLSRHAARETGAVTVLVSHRFSAVHVADHIVVLENGTIAEQGRHDELMVGGGRYAELYSAQAKAYS